MKRFIVLILIITLLLSTSACSYLSGEDGSSIKDTVQGVLSGVNEALEGIPGSVYDILSEEDALVTVPAEDGEDSSNEEESLSFKISSDDEEVYKPIIKLYRESTVVHIDGEENYNQPIDLHGSHSRILTRVNHGVNATARDCYYTYYDIDENGTPELLISNENRDTGFVDVYTISPERTATAVFFGDFTGRNDNINNVSLLKASNGTYFVLETGDKVSYGIFLYYISENCSNVEFSDNIWVALNDGKDPETADRKGELMYFNANEEISKERFDELEKAYMGNTILYNWRPVQSIKDYQSPLSGLQLPEKLFAPLPYTVMTTLNVREAPDIGSNIIDVVPIESHIIVIGSLSINGKWVFIRYTVGDRKEYRFGWARTENLQEGHIIFEKKNTRKR